jgi:hypothetical protein
MANLCPAALATSVFLPFPDAAVYQVAATVACGCSRLLPLGAGLIERIPESEGDTDVERAQGQRTGRTGLEENKSISIEFYHFNSLAGIAKNVNAKQCPRKTLSLRFCVEESKQNAWM